MVSILPIIYILLQISCFAQAQLSNVTKPYLNVTALTANNDASILQCWRVQPGFEASTQQGTNQNGALGLQLGAVANISYSILPPRTNAGLHTAPAMQWVVFLSGIAHITLPNSTAEAWIQGGKYGVLFSADTSEVSQYGHSTEYPSDAATVALQIPTGGVVPEHEVLYEGACQWDELIGV